MKFEPLFTQIHTFVTKLSKMKNKIEKRKKIPENQNLKEKFHTKGEASTKNEQECQLSSTKTSIKI